MRKLVSKFWRGTLAFGGLIGVIYLPADLVGVPEALGSWSDAAVLLDRETLLIIFSSLLVLYIFWNDARPLRRAWRRRRSAKKRAVRVVEDRSPSSFSSGAGGVATVLGSGTAIGGRGGDIFGESAGRMLSAGKGGDAFAENNGGSFGGVGGSASVGGTFPPPAPNGYFEWARDRGMVIPVFWVNTGAGAPVPGYAERHKIVANLILKDGPPMPDVIALSLANPSQRFVDYVNYLLEKHEADFRAVLHVHQILYVSI